MRLLPVRFPPATLSPTSLAASTSARLAGGGGGAYQVYVYDLAYAMVLEWPVEVRRALEEPVLRHYHARPNLVWSAARKTRRELSMMARAARTSR